MEKYESAKAQLLQARKPFDDALDALEQMKNNRDYVIAQFIELCRYLHPSAYQYQTVRDLLESGKMPQLWCIRDATSNIISDIRIEGALDKKDSFIDYLKNVTSKPPQ